jgi:hypothetical protein
MHAMTSAAVEQFSVMAQVSIAIGLLAVAATQTNDSWTRSIAAHQRPKHTALFAKIKEADTRSAVNFRCKKGS